MDLKEIGCNVGVRIDVAQDRVEWQAYVAKVNIRNTSVSLRRDVT